MKKNLQAITLCLVASVFFSTVGFSQSQLVEKGPKAIEVSMEQKEAVLLWDQNWQPEATATAGIVSSKLGGVAEPNLTLSADDFVVPEGKIWTITSIWARGFLSTDDAGNPIADADGFGFRLYEDLDGVPGDLVTEVLVENPNFDPIAPQIDLDTPIEVGAGTYWVGVYAYFASAEAFAEGRWNQYAWVPTTPVLTNAHLRDYGNFFGMADAGWADLVELVGANYEALDFAVWGTEADAGGADTYAVTFVVNMTDAVAVGDVAFDPALHRVFLSGTFAGPWATPGSDDAFELFPVAGTKEEVVALEEGFEGETFPPDGWSTVDEDGDGNVWFAYAADGSANTGLGSAASASWTSDAGALTPDNWLITPQVTIDNDTYMLQFYVGAQDPDWAAENYAVLISTTGNDPAAFTNVWEETLEDGEWYMREVDLSAYAGEQIYIAFRHYDVTDMFYIKIDDVKVSGTTGPAEDIFYTTTLQIEAGEQEYKYFLVADEATWGLGEAEGTDNRVVMIEADVTFNDMWGDISSSVDNVLAETGINMYPNPVRNTLFVENSAQINEVRIFDLTGRLIMSQQVNGNVASVNVSEFNQGVYVMQVISVNGVAAQKFNVIK